MNPRSSSPSCRPFLSTLLALAALAAALASGPANAIPAFNRQTGQNCVACHAGGQYPELTRYGRLFKLTGYTIGSRAIPLAIMGVESYTRVKNTSSPDPNFNEPATFVKNGLPIFATGSLFLAGKITDNIGGFAQITYSNYDSQDPINSEWTGHTTSDNLDIRFADRFITPASDLIYGVTVNNNPSVSDPFNSAPAWGFNVVPGSTGPATAPLIFGGLAQNVAGVGAYAYWNQLLYGEVGVYRTANGIFSFMSQGFNTDRGNMNIIKSGAPYWRLALTRDWGPHHGMVGLMGLNAHVYPDPTDPTGPTNDYRDVGIDAQYQYIFDPHAFTLTASYVDERIDYAGTIGGQCAPLDPDCSLGFPLTNTSDKLHSLQLKASYTYGAKYGGTLSMFNVTGTTNSMLQSSAFDPANPGQPLDGSQGVSGNATGNPATRGYTAELFWLPIQNVRAGLQYTWFDKYNGSSTNYDAFGRNAADNNTLFGYVWFAF